MNFMQISMKNDIISCVYILYREMFAYVHYMYIKIEGRKYIYNAEMMMMMAKLRSDMIE